MIACDKCGLQDLLPFMKNPDEVYLDFLTRFDEGKTPSQYQMDDGLKQEGIIRDEKEIKKMIAGRVPDEITKSVLFSKKDYVSEFKTLKKPPPKFGLPVDQVGLDKKISDYLLELEIKKFYKFQEEAINEIVYGNNVIIEAPTASGKTEASITENKK